MTSAQNEAIADFALNFGVEWHIGSEFKEESSYDESTNLKDAYSIKDFLNKETQRLNYQPDVLTWINLVHAHTFQAEKSLMKLTENEKETKSFVLEPVIADPYPAREEKSESIFDKITQH